MDRAIFAAMRDAEAAHWWFAGRRRILASVLEQLPPAPGPRVLDAGAGFGGNVPLLERHGIVIAVEPDGDAVHGAASRAPAVRAFFAPHLPFATASFGLVGLFDVLEHVPDDAAAAAEIARVLQPGGRLVMTVPAHPWLFGPHDTAHHHYRRYTRDGLRTVLAGAGLVVERCTFFNALLFPAAVLARMVSRLRGDTAVTTTLVPPPGNALLTQLFGAERHLLRHVDLPTGLSLLAVARRPPE